MADKFSKLNNLTKREREVFVLVTDGYVNKVIAHKLGVGDKCIEAHRRNVMQKTESNCLADLIAIRRQCSSCAGE